MQNSAPNNIKGPPLTLFWTENGQFSFHFFFLVGFFKFKKFLNVSFQYLILYFKHNNVKIKNDKNKEK